MRSPRAVTPWKNGSSAEFSSSTSSCHDVSEQARRAQLASKSAGRSSANAHHGNFAKAASASKHDSATAADRQIVLRCVQERTKRSVHALRLMRKQVQRAVSAHLGGEEA